MDTPQEKKVVSPWDRVVLSRHPARPHSLDYIRKMGGEFIELHGDRLFSDDHAIVGGLLRIEGQKFIVIGQEKGNDTDSRLYRNFGMVHPEGYRKALRLMRLAERFDLPVLSLIDTPGAHPGLEAEERGQGWAIAHNLREMSQIGTPIIVVVIGEGCSGGALGIGVGDAVGMLENAYYSVITPEGCATILWDDANRRADAAQRLRLTAEDLLSYRIIDKVIAEPEGGAHQNPQQAIDNARAFVLEEWEALKGLSKQSLLDRRYAKWRAIGAFEEGL